MLVEKSLWVGMGKSRKRSILICVSIKQSFWLVLVQGVNLSNPSPDIKTHDWLQWYAEIQTKLQKVKEENTKTKDDIDRRQERYETREDGYRETIDGL